MSEIDRRGEMARFLKGLASESRQSLLLDVFANGVPRTVGEVAKLSGLAQSTTSECLASMQEAGILCSERVGKQVLYRPDRTSILDHLARFVDMVACCCPPASE